MSATRFLKERIERDGPVSIAGFMELALAHPEGGYYMGRDPFGRGGDFTTAPEVSQMFGEILGLWSAVTWQAMGAPATVRLVELGPGRGTLMADALRAVSRLQPFAAALDVHMVETSPALRGRQTETLKPFADAGLPVSWGDTFDAVPEGPAIVLANEFFDALPIRQFYKTASGWRERLVGLGPGGDFRFQLAEVEADPALIPEGAVDAAEETVVETAAPARAIMEKIAARVVASGGAALVIDYGYGAGETGETLQAVKGHRYHDVLKDVGEADLTAHVNFAALAAAARAMGADVFGPVPQGAFLERLGLGERLGALLAGASPEQAAELESAYRRLTAADEMGLLFKVLAVTAPGLDVAPWS